MEIGMEEKGITKNVRAVLFNIFFPVSTHTYTHTNVKLALSLFNSADVSNQVGIKVFIGEKFNISECAHTKRERQ